MTKKDAKMKRMLGKKLKQGKERMPILVSLRTHRRLQRNLFGRNWRHQKIKKE
jgi:ribosomal protein L39E